MLIKLYDRHLLMKLNYNATHFECFSLSRCLIMQSAFLQFLDRAGYDGRRHNHLNDTRFARRRKAHDREFVTPCSLLLV